MKIKLKYKTDKEVEAALEAYEALLIEREKTINIYALRLYHEWKQHGKIVLSVDYDSTIFPYHTIENSEDIKRTIALVKLAKETGAYIVIFTASDPERHQEIRDYCKSIGIEIDSININPIELPYGKHGKIYYNINLCDRSGLTEALDILELAMYKIRGDQASNLIIGEHAKTND